jgi:hypothetical protein
MIAVSPAPTLPANAVPVTTVPMPDSVKQRSIARRKRPSALRTGCAVATVSRWARSAGTPSPVTADSANTGLPCQPCAGQQRLDLAARRGQSCGIDRIALAQCHRAAVEAEQAQQFQVLARLRHRAVVGGDHQQHEVDAGGAGEHVVDQLFVAGHVDEAEHRTIRQRRVGVTEVERDAARLLFRQAVGIDAGEGFHQRGLAVVDVAPRCRRSWAHVQRRQGGGEFRFVLRLQATQVEQ